MFPSRIGESVQPAILSVRLQKPGQVEGLEFGHSGSVNPKGCQRVAGGRRGFSGTSFLEQQLRHRQHYALSLQNPQPAQNRGNGRGALRIQVLQIGCCQLE